MFENPNFLSSILPAQEWSQGVIRHFGKLVMWYTTHIWIAFEDSPWNYMKKWHEVGQNPDQIRAKFH